MGNSLYISYQLLTNDYFSLGPAGPETLPNGAGERLPGGKHAGILTYFQAKIKKKVLDAGGQWFAGEDEERRVGSLLLVEKGERAKVLKSVRN